MVSWMGCGVSDFPFTYLGLPIGEKIRRINVWNLVVEKFKSLLDDWKAKSMSFRGSLTLVKTVLDMEGLGLEFASSCRDVLGDVRDIRFWTDRWVGDQRLCDRFSRLFYLDRSKEGSVRDKGTWENGMWFWKWDWGRNIRGRVCNKLDDLVCVLQNVVVSKNCKDRWKWTLFDGGVFKVKDLTCLIEDKILHVESGGQETLWNKLVQKKVNIFVWEVLKGRLPVREELNKRGIELDSVLCQSYNNVVESCTHCLVTCELAMSMWDKIFSWWKLGRVNAFSLDEFFSSNGNVSVPNIISCV
ncbi:reverse transcriptase domain, reverse transcriptase zinc-binding domain protein [Tanacetum coccineum]